MRIEGNSGRMLERLGEQAQADGLAERIDLRQLSWLGDWDDLSVPDVFLASRSLYSTDLHETILKMKRHARRRICLTVSTADGPAHDNAMLRAIGRPRSERSEFVYVVNLLLQMGRFPELSYISHIKPVFGSTAEELRSEFEREDGPFTPEEARLLEEFIAEQFEPAEKPDGTPAMTRRYDRPVRWAFIAWEPPLR